MKSLFKYFLLALLTAIGQSVYAQHWTAPSEGEYSGETPLYAQVEVNGVYGTQIELAAFVDGECRGVATAIAGSTNHTLRVWGDPTADNGKDITLKAYYEGMVYVFKTTYKWTGESQKLGTLSVDAITDIAPFEINKTTKTFPYTLNVASELATKSIVYEYGDSQPKGQTKLDTSETTFKGFSGWDIKSSVATINSSTGIATFTDGGNAYIGVAASFETVSHSPTHGPETKTFGTSVLATVSQELVAVESMTANLNILKPVGLTYGEFKTALNVQMLPVDATDKSYYIDWKTDSPFVSPVSSLSDDATLYYPVDGMEFTIHSTSNPTVSLDGTLTTFWRAGDIMVMEDPLTIDAGAKLESILQNATVGGDGSHTVTLEVEGGATLFDATGGALPGQYTCKYVVTDPDGVRHEAAFVLIVRQPLKSILVSPPYATNAEGTEGVLTAEVGDNVGAKLLDIVRITPADATDPALVYNIEKGGTTPILNGEGIAIAVGDARYAVSSSTYPDVAPVLIHVYVNPPITFSVETSNLSKYEDTPMTITCNRPDDVDPDKFELTFANHPALGQPACDITEVKTISLPKDEKRWQILLRGLAAGNTPYTLSYDGKVIDEGEVFVKAEVALRDGWDWIAPYAYTTSDAAGAGVITFDRLVFDNKDGGKILDVRSQTGLLYNDPEWGIFGDIAQFSSIDGMYKVKTTTPQGEGLYGRYDVGRDYVLASAVEGKPITRAGYNWVAYRQEFSRTFESCKTYLETHYAASEGDKIIGKSGSAEYHNGQWVAPEDFVMEAGKGYLYYTLQPKGNVLDFASDDADELPYSDFDRMLNGFPGLAASQRKTSQPKTSQLLGNLATPWQYDPHRFADNMPIVATLPHVDGGESLTIGAFVGDECRGKGTFVEDHIAIINVAGTAGETIHFRLYDANTGCYTDINETLLYSQMAGSMQTPVQFTAGTVTGLTTPPAALQSNNHATPLYHLSGRRANATAKGIHIQNGTKVIR